ncbi:hypothetical protein GQR58_005125 [Nymphon striatum]|nr:hypothetical protein GQR58_005125 [Nymphon striatum]
MIMAKIIKHYSLETLRADKTALLAGTAISLAAAAFTASLANAQTVIACDAGDCSPEAYVIETGANTEQSQESFEIDGPGFSISVDGEQLEGNEQAVDQQRQTDIDLETVDIQVKFDGLEVRPVLNVSTDDLRHSYEAGDPVRFVATSNYPSWIDRSEIWIYREGDERFGRPHKVLQVDAGSATWVMPEEGEGDFSYILRVYDAKGRYDETVPLGLARTSQSFETHDTSPEGEPVDVGEDGYKVSAIGEEVAIDNDNAFVIQRILPPGEHSVAVSVTGNADGKLEFNREINIPENDWFYVGLADLTVGRRFGSPDLIAAAPGEYDRTYTKGRLAFYLKGKIKGRYILTAAADTGEDDLDNLFRNLDSKDPRQLLRRIDPDDYYPVYGDDSTIYEDAPTQGKFYVRLEKDNSHVMWGSFKTEISGTEFARNERGLYGAHAILKSEAVTSFGEPVAEIEAYAAEPDTLPQRDVLRGTGGSVYFLTRQDITRGSETVTIEIRDPVSGIVRSRQVLRYGDDYEIDYIQGVIILNKPLSSTADGGSIISDGALGDDIVNLVAQYEFTPTLGNIDGYSYGGRAHVWINDNVKVGVTALQEESGPADNRILEADVKVRLSENSYIRGEIAQSSGPGFGRSNSINGGLTIDDTPTSGRENRDALAYRLETHIDIADIDPDQKGKIGAYYERREEGFSSLDYETTVTQRIWGVFADVEVNEDVRYRIAYEDFSDEAGRVKREADAEIEFALAPDWSLTVGAKHTDLQNPGTVNENGRRTDVGAQVTYQPDDDHKYYIFGQATVDRSGDIERNDRIGIGAEARVSEKLSLTGEVSYGSLGWGGEAGLAYDPTADSQYYIGYRVDPDRERTSLSPLNGRDLGSIVAGARHKYNDRFSAYLENSYDAFGSVRSLTSTYGVTYTPSDLWNVDLGLEYGDVSDPVAGELSRTAISTRISYDQKDEISWFVRGEARFENSNDPAKDRDTYFASAGLTYKQDEDWRLLLHFDAALSNSNQAAFLDGDYIEASIGYAYRPTDNDKFNALFKYNFLYDLPGPDQVTVNGNTLGASQRSHILSADFTYDVNQYLSVGAKYGFRIGEVSLTRNEDDFVQSSAHLAVARIDWHVVNNWDVLLEARVLHTPEIDTTDYGALAAVYRHVGDNFKVGVGYNFGSFSDDLSDLTKDDGGVFVNIVGKF